MFILIQQAKAKASVSVDAIILSAVDSKVGFKVEEILYVTIFLFSKVQGRFEDSVHLGSSFLRPT